MDVAGFALAVLLIELTPGPNMAWLVTLTLSQGRAAGMAAIGGVALGLLANALLSAVGASILLTRYEWLQDGIGFAAGLMMLYLAWTGWRETSESSTAELPRKSAGKHFGAGFVINLLNVKATLFFVSVAPQFVAGSTLTIREGMLLAITSAGIATLVHLLLIVGASKARPFLLVPERSMLIRRVLAIAILGVAIWFFAGALA